MSFLRGSTTQQLTIDCEIHSSKFNRSDNLPLHLLLEVDEESREVAVGVVGDTSGGDALEEFGGWELGCQLREMLVYESTQWDAII